MNLSWAFVLIPTSSLRASFTRGCVGTNLRTPPIGDKVQLQAPSRCCAARHSALLWSGSGLVHTTYLHCAGRFTAPSAPVAPGLLLPISMHTAYRRLVSFRACMQPEHPQSGLPVLQHALEFNARFLGRALPKALRSAVKSSQIIRSPCRALLPDPPLPHPRPCPPPSAPTRHPSPFLPCPAFARPAFPVHSWHPAATEPKNL